MHDIDYNVLLQYSGIYEKANRKAKGIGVCFEKGRHGPVS